MALQVWLPPSTTALPGDQLQSDSPAPGAYLIPNVPHIPHNTVPAPLVKSRNGFNGQIGWTLVREYYRIAFEIPDLKLKKLATWKHLWCRPRKTQENIPLFS